MKHVFILLGLLLMLPLTGYCQHAFGVKAGGNLATVKRDNSFGTDDKHRIGFHMGFLAEKDISQKTYIRSELFHSRKGSKIYDSSSGMNYSRDSDYLNLPLLIGYRLSPAISFYFGPELGYALGHSKDYANDHRDFDFGLDGGILYNLTSAFALDLRYTYGLVKMGNIQSTSGTTPIYDGQNRVAQLGVNYYFKQR
jgi:opacity protein-like surface antigen